jgi:hypothetical protein
MEEPYMNRLRTVLLTILLLVGLSVPAVAYTAAVEVFYELTDLGSGQWQYSYTVRNNSLEPVPGFGITWFNTYFPATQVSQGHYDYWNIAAVSPFPPGWESAGVYDPDVNRPDGLGGPPGVYGAGTKPGLADSAKIQPSGSVGGFSVTFSYAGSGTPPGPQVFEVKDDDADDPNFYWFRGMTQPIAVVPSPPSVFLLAAGLFGVAALRRKR